MNINFIGLTAAFSVFLGIWLGHVAVRKIEFYTENLWKPILITIILGLGLEACSLLTNHLLLSTGTGILGVTVLWDSFEFYRQQRRVIQGHAPVNPENSRHARILAASPLATTLDLLDRDPVGHPVDTDEAIRLITDHRPRS